MSHGRHAWGVPSVYGCVGGNNNNTNNNDNDNNDSNDNDNNNDTDGAEKHARHASK